MTARSPVGLARLSTAALAAFAAIAAGAPARAVITPAERAEVLGVARRIEGDAARSTYADLDAAGVAALKLKGADKFIRLEYVATQYLEGSKIADFQRWNRILKAEAEKDHAPRYAAIADLDAVMLKMLAGSPVAPDAAAKIAETSGDWDVRLHEQVNRANLLTMVDDRGDPLSIISRAEGLIQGEGPEARYARMEIYEARAFRLLVTYDLIGSAKMMAAVSDIYHEFGLPRPGHDELFDMAAIAIRLGDRSLASALIPIFDALEAKDDSPVAKRGHAILCAGFNEVFGESMGLLKCVEGVSPSASGVDLQDATLMVYRVAAFARAGRLKEALADFGALQRLRAQGRLPERILKRLPYIEAEIAAARGDLPQAMSRIRSYMNNRALDDATTYDDRLRELGREYDRNLLLRTQMVETQRILIGVSVAALLAGGALLILQMRLAGKYRHQRERAEAAVEAKAQFLSNMSHEIRTPLTAVIGFAELLMRRRDLSPDARSQVRRIIDGGEAVLLIINDVLDLSKIEAGLLELEIKPLNPREAVARVVGLAEGMAADKGLSIHVQTSDALPELVQGDESRLLQVLLNLINNAVKFTDVGEVRVSVDYDRARSRLSCLVSDTGCGIPEDRLERLFKRFSQADSSVSRRFGGSGLGLAIAKNLIQLMGGDISVRSKVGEGSEFAFHVHAPMSEAGAIGVERSAEFELAAGPMTGSVRKVLVVDDNPQNLELFRTLIHSLGYDVSLAASGEEAAERCAATPYDVVLMDVRMPGIGGLEAARRIRASGGPNAHTPILAITANVSPEDVVDCAEAGMQDHISKPVRITQLAERLSIWAEQSLAPAA